MAPLATPVRDLGPQDRATCLPSLGWFKHRQADPTVLIPWDVEGWKRGHGKCFGKHPWKSYRFLKKYVDSVVLSYFSFLLNTLWIVWGMKHWREMGSCRRILRQSLTWSPCGLGKEPNSRKGMRIGDRRNSQVDITIVLARGSKMNSLWKQFFFIVLSSEEKIGMGFWPGTLLKEEI